LSILVFSCAASFVFMPDAIVLTVWCTTAGKSLSNDETVNP
jgi:hypothetical protein